MKKLVIATAAVFRHASVLRYRFQQLPFVYDIRRRFIGLGRTLLDAEATYGPETLQLLCRPPTTRGRTSLEITDI
jgi:hypothetical protein